MSKAHHTVIEEAGFVAGARSILSDKDRHHLIDAISENPEVGKIIPGGGGARKMRFARKGEGKSGGLRVIYYQPGVGAPVNVLAVYAKSDKGNLTKAEISLLHDVCKAIKEDHKALSEEDKDDD